MGCSQLPARTFDNMAQAIDPLLSFSKQRLKATWHAIAKGEQVPSPRIMDAHDPSIAASVLHL
jgi:hypothetical protein